MEYAGWPVRVGVAAAAVPLVALLAGCGGSDDAAQAPKTTTTATPSTTQSATTSSAPTSTGPAPATGPQLSMNAFTLNLPEGWQITSGKNPDRAQAYVPDHPVGSIAVQSFRDLTNGGLPYALRQEKTSARTTLTKPATEQPDRVVDGVSGAVLTGSNSAYRTYYDFVAVHDGWTATIRFLINADLDDPQGLVDSVLASVHFVTPPAS